MLPPFRRGRSLPPVTYLTGMRLLLGLVFPLMKRGYGHRKRELPRVPKPKKITAAILEQIPTLIERGISPDEIADRIGCTRGTLRVACSKAKISLRKGDSDNLRSLSDSAPERTRDAAIPLNLPDMAIGRLRREAGKRGLAVATLASMLLEVIAQDNLYDAVLDEREAQRGTCGRAVPS